MNFDFYLFGTPIGYDQYPLDDKEVLFQSSYDKNTPVQLVLYRNAELIYFTYIRNITSGGHYFGMSIVFNGAYPANLSEVFAVFDSLFVNAVNKGRLLRKNKYGHIEFTGIRLAEAQDEIEELTRYCRTLVENRLSRSEILLPVEYVVHDRTVSFAFDLNYLPTPMGELLKYYNMIRLTKGKTGDIDPPKPTPTWVPPFVLAILIMIILAGVLLYYNVWDDSRNPLDSSKPQDTVLNHTDSVIYVEDELLDTISHKPKGDEEISSTVGVEGASQPKPPVTKPKPKEKPPIEKPKPKDDVVFVIKTRYSDGYYSGRLRNNVREGEGTFVFNMGDKYEGEWKNNKFHGYGIYTYSSQNPRDLKYEGHWTEGERKGEGTHYYKNGDRYDGNFDKGLANGKGKYYHANNGEVYEGEFKNGLPDGYGKEYYYNGSLKYEGEFRKGYYDGVGTYHYASGKKYHGKFKNGDIVK